MGLLPTKGVSQTDRRVFVVLLVISMALIGYIVYQIATREKADETTVKPGGSHSQEQTRTPDISDPASWGRTDYDAPTAPSQNDPAAARRAHEFMTAWVTFNLPKDQWVRGFAHYCDDHLATVLSDAWVEDAEALHITGDPVTRHIDATSATIDIPLNERLATVTMYYGEDGWIVGDLSMVRS
jgi:hypothetical protein